MTQEEFDQYLEDEGLVAIPQEDFAKLMQIVEFMDTLLANGVDNWEGYPTKIASAANDQ